MRIRSLLLARQLRLALLGGRILLLHPVAAAEQGGRPRDQQNQTYATPSNSLQLSRLIRRQRSSGGIFPRAASADQPADASVGVPGARTARGPRTSADRQQLDAHRLARHPAVGRTVAIVAEHEDDGPAATRCSAKSSTADGPSVVISRAASPRREIARPAGGPSVAPESPGDSSSPRRRWATGRPFRIDDAVRQSRSCRRPSAATRLT